jgi:hypothetical protein
VLQRAAFNRVAMTHFRHILSISVSTLRADYVIALQLQCQFAVYNKEIILLYDCLITLLNLLEQGASTPL